MVFNWLLSSPTSEDQVATQLGEKPLRQLFLKSLFTRGVLFATEIEQSPPSTVQATHRLQLTSAAAFTVTDPTSRKQQKPRQLPGLLKTIAAPQTTVPTKRRGRDSNPRYSCPYTDLANLRFRPLSHLSPKTRTCPRRNTHRLLRPQPIV